MVLMWPLEILYIMVVSIRNTYYDTYYKAPNKDILPITISVGNLSAGGTGKTPVCLFIYDLLKPIYKSAILLRGYTDQSGEVSDEALIYQKHIGKENVYVGSERLISIDKAIQNNVQLVILDDAFQHRKVFRHLNIVLIDMSKPPNKDKCFPRGFLREPMSSLKRADWLVLSRCNLVSNEDLNIMISEISKKFSHIKILKSQVEMSDLKCVHSELSSIKNTEFLLVCGIGNPDNFKQSVAKENLKIKNQLIFKDHHSYSERDILLISKELQKNNIKAILTTEKDWVKLSQLNIDFPVVVFEIKTNMMDLYNNSIGNNLINTIKTKMHNIKTHAN